MSPEEFTALCTVRYLLNRADCGAVRLFRFYPHELRIPGRFDTRAPDRVTYARLALNARQVWFAGRILGGIRGPYESRRTRAGVLPATEKARGYGRRIPAMCKVGSDLYARGF